MQQSKEQADAIIINAKAYLHYSIAIRDAIEAVCLPCIEVYVLTYLKEKNLEKNL